jgi:hypothetical protein
LITLSSSGDFSKTKKFLKKLSSNDLFVNLNKYGKMGVNALEKYTPEESGLTSESWGYRIINSKTNPGIEWYNTNTNDGVNVAILIQYGHGTGTGGYVEGIDYINPAIRPVFEKIVNDIWRQVKA